MQDTVISVLLAILQSINDQTVAHELRLGFPSYGYGIFFSDGGRSSL